MNPMQPPENQTPGQPSYGAPPAATAPSSLNVEAARAAFMAQQNRPYLIAAIGGLVAFLSYFILPFFGATASAFGVTRSDSITGSDTVGGIYGYWLLWLVPLAALVAIAIPSIIVLGIRAVQQITPSNAARYMMITGAVGLVAQIIVLFKINSDAANYFGAGTSVNLAQAGIKISSGPGFGFWLMLLSFIAVIVGGVMNMRQTQAAVMPGAAV